MVTRAREAGPLAREIEHTADLGIEVDAPTLAALFERAALGMLALMVDLGGVEPRVRVPLEVAADDREALLHDWLHAVLVTLEAKGVVLSEVAAEEVTDRSARGWGAGERLDPARHTVHTEIKGVSYHSLAVRETPAGWSARVIVDV